MVATRVSIALARSPTAQTLEGIRNLVEGWSSVAVENRRQSGDTCGNHTEPKLKHSDERDCEQVIREVIVFGRLNGDGEPPDHNTDSAA